MVLCVCYMQHCYQYIKFHNYLLGNYWASLTELHVHFAITYWILGNNSKGFIELRDRPIVANGDALLRGISVYNTVSMHCDIVGKMFTECHITYILKKVSPSILV